MDKTAEMIITTYIQIYIRTTFFISNCARYITIYKRVTDILMTYIHIVCTYKLLLLQNVLDLKICFLFLIYQTTKS